jgi:mono/diheme cytochrome c family protein
MEKALPLFILAAALVLQEQASMAADPAHGEQLAQRWCASCHVIGGDARQVAADQPPPFTSVARRPDFDVNRLAFFLLNPHPVMPNMALTRDEAADLAAYIAALRK